MYLWMGHYEYRYIQLMLTIVFEVKGYGFTCFSTAFARVLLALALDSADSSSTVRLFAGSQTTQICR